MSQAELPDGKLNYEEQIMAGLIAPEGYATTGIDVYTENLRYFLDRVEMETLQKENRSLVQCMKLYLEETSAKGPMDEHVLLDMLMSERAPQEIQVKYTELFARYARIDVSPAKFRYALNRFLKQVEETKFVQALNNAFTIQTAGLKLGKDLLQGYRAARDYIQKQIFEIEKSSSLSYVQEGDVRAEALDVVTEYEERRDNPKKYVGVKSGIIPIDDLTNGVQNGEVAFIGGYTEVGKSFFALNWADYACTAQGANIALGTAEVIYNQYRRRIALRRARNPGFGLPQGIDSDTFKKGKLSPQEEQGFRQAMEDFRKNPQYGRYYLFQIPRGATIEWVFNKFNSINSQWEEYGGLQLGVIDSLNLIAPENVGRDQRRVALNDMIKATKQMAVNFAHGRGLPIVSPWHANRRSWEEALEKGYYDLASWSDADELEKSADLLIWLLKMQNAHETHEILAGIEKYRDGAAKIRFTLYEDFASSYLGTVANSVVATTPGMAQPTVFDSRAEGLF